MNEIVDFVNRNDAETIIELIKESGKDIHKIIQQLKQSRTDYGLKVQELVAKLSASLEKYEIGQILEAKENCMNNFNKGQRATITRITDLDEIVVDDIVALDSDEVRQYFKIVG